MDRRFIEEKVATDYCQIYTIRSFFVPNGLSHTGTANLRVRDEERGRGEATVQQA